MKPKIFIYLFLWIFFVSNIAAMNDDTDADSKNISKNISGNISGKDVSKNENVLPIVLDNLDFYYRMGFDKKNVESKINLQDWQKKKGMPFRFKDLHDIDECRNNQKKSGISEQKIDKCSQVSYTIAAFFHVQNAVSLQYQTLGLQIPLVGHNWQVYLNGQLIESNMGLSPDGKIQNSKKKRNVVIDFPGSMLRNGKNLIVFRIHGDSRNNVTGFYYANGYIIDDYNVLAQKNSEIIDLILISLYFFLGLYHLLLFSKRPKDRYNLYFGLFAIGLFVYLFARSSIVLDLFPDAYVVNRIEFTVLFLMVPIFFRFLEALFFNKISKISNYYLIYSIVLALPVVFVPMVWNFQLLFIWQISALIFNFYGVYIFYRAIRLRRPEAKVLLFGFLLVISAAVFDILEALGLDTGITFTKYAFFVFVMGIAALLARRFLRVHNQVEELNANLEKKVEERTRKLQETLNKVQTLKVQQDGDYFLTSLLIKPLGQIFQSNDPVLVNGITIQKKKFEFHNRKGEIGGDLNVANKISLQGKEFIVFMNADAMGKSIQGAGGALVLGVVFNSFITRTHLSSLYQNKSPEQWIKDCYGDLQSVFETFDGSMLASLVLGLVDTKLGAMYFINAEHPWTVLYRSDKAVFIEDELYLHKVGINIGNENFYIKTKPLKKNDIIIMGSDGRDDILLGTDEDGNRIINEDEALFLKHVEMANGDLEIVSQIIEKAGELTDDFTLLSITFQTQSATELYDKKNLTDKQRENFKQGIQEYRLGNFSNAEKKMMSITVSPKDSDLSDARAGQGIHPEALYHLVRIQLKKKDFAAAAKYGLQYLQYFPLNNNYLFLTSFALKRSNQFDLACDLGERLRLREPNDVKNLINLADSYRHNHNLARSFFLVQAAIKLEPENAQALKLKQILQQSMESNQANT